MVSVIICAAVYSTYFWLCTPSLSMNKTFERLNKASEGLYYISESEYPFEVFCLTASPVEPVSAASVASWLGIPANVETETTTLDYFFRNMTKVYPGSTQEDKLRAERFIQLAEVLKQELGKIEVHRFGQRQIDACIVGKSEDGSYWCLKTKLIET